MTDYVDMVAGRRDAEAMLAGGFLPNFEVNRTVRPSEDEEAMIARCRELEVPTLIIHGGSPTASGEASGSRFARDPRPVSAIASLAEALPRSQVAVIPDAGHLPWFEQPAAFAEALRGFLRGLEG
jgi:proline iminopeptidase